MQPDFGSRLRELLFEQYTEDLTTRIKQEIQEAMSTWLPYIDIAKVDVIQNETIPTETKVDIDFSLNYEPNRFNSITLNFDTTSESTTTSGGY
jgi:phage baseplate assembly protein W